MITFKGTAPEQIVGDIINKSMIKVDPTKTKQEFDRTSILHLAEEGTSIEDILSKRRSVRFFNEKPVKLHDLLNILYNNYHFISNSFKNPNMFDQYVLIRNTDDKSISNNHIYLYDVNSKSIIKKEEVEEEKIQKLFLQKEFSEAPANIVLVAKLEEFLKESSPSLRGYKDMLIQSGSILYYSWLYSLSLGYEGTVYAGFNPRLFYQISGIDGYRQYQVLAFAFGYTV
ncbi:nitroreductase family protein [Virgibacillus dokdonensis]|uniref:nitroreductase family protein n=1 Tax=Virgibacillus dokdonensis TaxID=302167 RepID=UPI00098A34AF|nr:nitroreductase family protein [Virgibacillus dokdonensis]